MRRFLNFVNVFSLFVIISPLERSGTLFVCNYLPLERVGKKIFKFRQCIFIFRNYPTLERGGDLHLNKIESPLPKDDYIVSSLVEIGPVVLEKTIFKFRQCIFAIS